MLSVLLNKHSNINIYSIFYKNRKFVLLNSLNFYVVHANIFNYFKIRWSKWFMNFGKSNISGQFSIYLKKFYSSWYNFLSRRIKFRYKGAWLRMKRKNQRFLLINLKHSHYLRISMADFYVRRRGRFLDHRPLTVWGFNFSGVYSISQTIVNMRLASTFTTMGVRFAKQVFLKRVGKISKYTTMKTRIF